MKRTIKKPCGLLAQSTGAFIGCVIILPQKNDDTFNGFFQVRIKNPGKENVSSWKKLTVYVVHAKTYLTHF